MRVAGPVLLLALAACASSDEAAPAAGSSPAGRAASQPWERDPFTRTSLIEIDGKAVGYLVEYQPIPEASGIERALPTGSYRIQASDFEDVGFITPRGEVRRYEGKASRSLGFWPLDEGVIVFFGGGRRARFTALEPTLPKPAAPATGEATGDPAAEPAGEGGEPAAEGG